jgi:DNA-binding transcriptional ArsR family regulator
MRTAPNDVFRAIADPTRRAILDLLASSERSVKELTASFPMTQQAVSQHLRELHDAKLVVSRRVHRENRYRLNAGSLRPVANWISGFRRFIDPAGHQWAISSPKEEKHGN